MKQRTGIVLSFCILTLTLFFSSCNSSFTPKPRGYYQIPFPPKKYQVFQQPGYPYTFEYPVYAKVSKDSTYFGKKTENDWWINIDFPQFAGRIYVSYNIIGGKASFQVKQPDGTYKDSMGTNTLDKLINGSYTLTYKHATKADGIADSVFRTINGVHGTFFNVGGNAATANQFFVTDSLHHFLRGALYFDATPNEDSLSIVNNFLLQDMKHLINTFKWQQPQ